VNQDEDMRTTFCGTYEYMAPEIVENKGYDRRVDIWSLGILLYEMLHGYSPFRGSRMLSILDNIRKGIYRFESFISQEARSLISSILVVDVERRPTIEQVLKHPFLIKHGLIQQAPSPQPQPNTAIQYHQHQYPQQLNQVKHLELHSPQEPSTHVFPEPHHKYMESPSPKEQAPLSVQSISIQPPHPMVTTSRPPDHVLFPPSTKVFAAETPRSRNDSLIRQDTMGEGFSTGQKNLPSAYATQEENSVGGAPLNSHRSFQDIPTGKPMRKPSLPQSHQRNRSSNIIPEAALNNPEQFLKRNNSNNSFYQIPTLSHTSSGGMSSQNGHERSNSRNNILERNLNMNIPTHGTNILPSTPIYLPTAAAQLPLEYGSLDHPQAEPYIQRSYDTPTAAYATLLSKPAMSSNLKNPLEGRLAGLSHREYNQSPAPATHTSYSNQTNNFASGSVRVVDQNSSIASINGQTEQRDNSIQRQNPLMQSFGKRSNNTSAIINTSDVQRISEQRRDTGENILGEITNKVILNQICKASNGYGGSSSNISMNRQEDDLEYSLQGKENNRSAYPKLTTFYVKENYAKNERLGQENRERSHDIQPVTGPVVRILGTPVSSGACTNSTPSPQNYGFRSKLHSQIQNQLVQTLTSQQRQVQAPMNVLQTRLFEKGRPGEGNFSQGNLCATEEPSINHPKVFDRGNSTLRTASSAANRSISSNGILSQVLRHS
jgi:hypothetical protein